MNKKIEQGDKHLIVVREAGVKYGKPKLGGKTMHIREDDATYIERESTRRIRANADQIAHLRRLHEAVVHELFDGNDDLDTILSKLREWKKKVGEGK